jgi:aminocarboxymuconate-semialdehyde decarboxylase
MAEDAAAPASAYHARVATRAVPRTVDVHAHALSPRLVELTAGHRGPPNAHNEHLMRTTYRTAFDSVDARLQAMQGQGIDLQVVSHMPNFGYWADQNLSEQIVMAANELIAAMCREHPTRFVGLCLVSLQFPEVAARQLEQATATMGMRGVEIGTFVNGMELGDARLEPFWATAERLGALVFIHPTGSTLGGRLAPYYLSNIIGNPLDTTIALSHLIFSGTLERHPRLNIVAAHGGGYLPSYAPRTDHGFEVRPEAQTIPRPPSEYLHRLYVDALVYKPQNVAHLVREMGAGHVVLGTDYPFDMGEDAPVAVLNGVPDLSDADRELICRGNASRLLGLE